LLEGESEEDALCKFERKGKKYLAQLAGIGMGAGRCMVIIRKGVR